MQMLYNIRNFFLVENYDTLMRKHPKQTYHYSLLFFNLDKKGNSSALNEFYDNFVILK